MLPTTFFRTLVTGKVILDSFYIMLTTNYIFQMLYTGKYIPYFIIRIKLPDIYWTMSSGHVKRDMHLSRLTCMECHNKSDMQSVTC